MHGPTVAISVSLLLVLCGSFLETFNFNFLGLAGYALGPDWATRMPEGGRAYLVGVLDEA